MREWIPGSVLPVNSPESEKICKRNENYAVTGLSGVQTGKDLTFARPKDGGSIVEVVFLQLFDLYFSTRVFQLFFQGFRFFFGNPFLHRPG